MIPISEDWGETGHRATGEIAEKHLSKKAKRAINDLLDGKSLAFVSTFADEIRSDKTYKNYGSWHYVNFPFDSNYNDHPKSEKGDIIVAINKCIEVLEDDSSDKEEKAFHLKMLVHFIGDLHQPLHVGMAKDKGGNTFQVEWFGNGTNLHSVWDTKIIESYNMSYSELAANAKVLSKEQVKVIQNSNVIDWMNESRELCKKVYNTTKSGENLRFEYRYIYMPIIRDRLQKGGIRLASVLNDIFG